LLIPPAQQYGQRPKLLKSWAQDEMMSADGIAE